MHCVIRLVLVLDELHFSLDCFKRDSFCIRTVAVLSVAVLCGGSHVGDGGRPVLSREVAVMPHHYFPVMTVSPQSIEVVDAVVAVPVGLIIIGVWGWRERIRISRWLGVHGDDVQS